MLHDYVLLGFRVCRERGMILATIQASAAGVRLHGMWFAVFRLRCRVGLWACGLGFNVGWRKYSTL